MIVGAQPVDYLDHRFATRCKAMAESARTLFKRSPQGSSVQELLPDRDALEVGLRLSQAKFGNVVELSGAQAFQLEAALVAADVGLYITFEQAGERRMADQLDDEQIAGVYRFTEAFR